MKNFARKNLKDYVYNYPTKHKQGFIKDDLEKILNEFPRVNMDKFNDAMMGNTAMLINNEIINYHIDVYHALLAGLENRNLTIGEFD